MGQNINMTELWKHSISSGWKLASELFLCEELLLVVYDKKSRRDALRGVKANTFTALKRQIIHQIARGSGPNLYYTADGGIYSFNLSTGVEMLLTAIDSSEHVVEGLWASPMGTIFYTQTRTSRFVSENNTASMIAGPTTINRISPTADAVPKEIIRFEGPASFVTFSWSQNAAFVTLGEMAKFRISRVDLDSGKELILEESNVNIGLAISSRDTLIMWSLRPRKIEERCENGDHLMLAGAGSCPSFSALHGHMAYMGETGDVWLKYDNEQPQRIFAPQSVDALNEIEVPTWCGCGRHFAVSVEVSPAMNASGRATLCADIEKKELFFLDDSAPYYRRTFMKA